MDFTETFIKMSDCPEIQALRREEHNKDTGKWQVGDFWTHITDRIERTVFVVPDYRDAWADIPDYIHHPSECIWLPRQDELQAMVPLKMSASWVFLDAFIGDYMQTIDESYDFPDWDSWEQIWLAFVMFELYHKIWSNGKWEKV